MVFRQNRGLQIFDSHLHMDIPNLLPSGVGFSQITNGSPSGLYIIHSHDRNCVCAITSYGARLVSLIVPDRKGNPTDVALGYSDIDGYMQLPEDYCGAIVGRCANRIAAGLFVLDGYTYALPINNGHNTLHGGILGFHGRKWEVIDVTGTAVKLRYVSMDGEEGFPGTLTTEVTYAWTDESILSITYQATTEKATLVNLSNHAYFNLSGQGSDTAMDHEIHIDADAITPVDNTLIPTGALMPVRGTPFDFIEPQRIGGRIDSEHEQLRFGAGYDHNFVLNKRSGGSSVTLRSPITGIQMDLQTDRPGLQFYSGNFMDGSRKGKSGKPYGHRSAIVLEPQGFPDAIHHPGFPSVVLRPGAEYHAVDTYSFSTT